MCATSWDDLLYYILYCHINK